jgi:xanthine dehydrogenase accessory factor
MAMQAVDNEVLSQVSAWLEAGKPCWLATVVGTWGSSPRPVGSLLACDRDGRVTGSLSGGCVEDDLLEKLKHGDLARERAQFFRYGVTAEETERLGLPCGGHLDITVEPLAPTAARIDEFRRIVGRLARRRCVQRTVDLRSGTVAVRDVDIFDELSYDADRERLRQTYGPRMQLFIIGAGMISRYLAEMAQMLDYAVTLCDPRQHLLDEFAVPGITKLCDMPDDAIRARADDPSSAIVALTHDPRVDDMGLMEALKTEAFYVGAMGSRRTSEGRRRRLEALDLSPEEIGRLHAPIGLPIGSKTPPEIAIAILAEITAVRKQRERVAREHLAALAETA